METSVISSLTFDCANPAVQAEFWAVALGYQIKSVDENRAEVIDPKGQNPRLLFLVVPEGKTAKNRLHFDLRAPESMEAEVERLVALGARKIQVFRKPGDLFTVMHDPEGNEFCVEQPPQ